MTATGMVSSEPVATLANGSSIRHFRPGRTTTSPTTMSSLRSDLGIALDLDVIDDRTGYVDATRSFYALESW